MSADIERWEPPNDPVAFESLCLDLWRDIWRGSGQKNGRRGQPQAGVDVFGECDGKWIGVQCKQKDGLLRHRVTLADLEGAVGEAFHFSPRLHLFILATTRPRDGKLQQRAAELTEAHRKLERFTVEVWSWEEIWHELYQRKELLERVAPIYWPRLNAIGSKAVMKQRTEVLLDAALAAIDANDFLTAARNAEACADIAGAAGDQKTERYGLVQAVRAFGEYLGCQHPPQGEITATLTHARKLVARLEALGERPAIIALHHAQLGRFDRPTHEVIEHAAHAAQDNHPTIRAEALVIHLQSLWRTRDWEAIVDLEPTVRELCKTASEEDLRLILEATWLRTLCKAGRHEKDDILAFVNILEAVPGPSYQRTAMVIGQVAAEFNRAGHFDEARTLCEATFRLVEGHANGRMLMNIALQIAELSAQMRDAGTARLYLGRAESWATRGHRDSEQALSDRANLLFAKGRTLARIADQSEPANESLYRAAYDALDSARSHGQEHRSKLPGEVDLFLADVSWWLGRVAANLGELAKACECLSAVRSDAALANARFRDEVVSRAWLLEAESLALFGRIAEAETVVASLIADTRVSKRAKARAHLFASYLKERVRPLLEWFETESARAIAIDCGRNGLRRAIASQLAPLVTWWGDWNEPGKGAESELFDFWGRGGFASIAAAIRGRAHAAIAVDARSIPEIRTWARVLCPLFETVIIKWKGDLGTGIVLVPHHEHYEGAGGHGYIVTSDHTSNSDYVVSMSWANPLAQEVTRFLAGEALPLFKAGRLLVLPAPLVGCSQSAVGWTDNLLLEGLLGGIVDVGRYAGRDTNTQRFLDLSRVTLPFVDDIGMSDLAAVLDDSEHWIVSLRAQIMSVLSSGDLNHERWASISSLDQEIQNACREFSARLTDATRAGNWHVSLMDSFLTVGSRGPSPVRANDGITGLLQSVTSGNRELAPWIPYWRLQDRGGYLNWTCPLDNQSTPPSRAAIAQLPHQQTPELHSWLYPGTPGWGLVAVRRLSIEG